MNSLSEYLQAKRKLCENARDDTVFHSSFAATESEKSMYIDARTTLPKLLDALERATDALRHYSVDIGRHETRASKALADIERILLEVKP